MVKNSMQTSFFFLMHLGNGFVLNFGGFWVAKRSQVGTKMGSKIDSSENLKKRIWN